MIVDFITWLEVRASKPFADKLYADRLAAEADEAMLKAQTGEEHRRTALKCRMAGTALQRLNDPRADNYFRGLGRHMKLITPSNNPLSGLSPEQQADKLIADKGILDRIGSSRKRIPEKDLSGVFKIDIQ